MDKHVAAADGAHKRKQRDSSSSSSSNSSNDDDEDEAVCMDEVEDCFAAMPPPPLPPAAAAAAARAHQPPPLKKPALLPGKNEDMDFGEMLSLDDDGDNYSDDDDDDDEEEEEEAGGSEARDTLSQLPSSAATIAAHRHHHAHSSTTTLSSFMSTGAAAAGGTAGAGARSRASSAHSEASDSSLCTDDDVVHHRKKRGVRGLLAMNQDHRHNQKHRHHRNKGLLRHRHTSDSGSKQSSSSSRSRASSDSSGSSSSSSSSGGSVSSSKSSASSSSASSASSASSSARRNRHKAAAAGSASSSSGSSGSSSSSDEFDDEVEDLFDETLEEIHALEAKQQQQLQQQQQKQVTPPPQLQLQHTSQRTLDVLRKVPFFAQFSAEHQEQLFSELEEETFTDGVSIVSQGDLGDKFYVIVHGEAVVSKLDDATGEFRDLTHIYAGDFFGELVLIYGGERVATVTSVGKTRCMSLSKRAFEKYASIRYFLILQKVPLLAGLARHVQLEIVRRLKPAKFNADELVVKQHDRGDAFFFITRGSALVIDEDDGDKIITRLYEGHTFGEMALMSDAPRVASVRSGSGSELHCMFLSVQDFKELLSADEFAGLVGEESKKIRELRDKRTLFKQMRANSTNSFDTVMSGGSPYTQYSNQQQRRESSVDSPGGAYPSSQLRSLSGGRESTGSSFGSSPTLSLVTSSTSSSALAAGSPGGAAVPGTPGTPRMQQKLKTGKTQGGSKIINNYVLLEQIGKGTFGIVRLCENHGQHYAIKIIDKSLFKNKVSSKHQSTMEDMRREASIMKKLNHPNVVNLIDVIDDPKADQLYLVQEYCAGGAVMENLEGSQPLDEPLARRYFRDLLCGIDYLHAHQIVHRDIKPMNLLITSTGLLKIGDFGAARVLSSDSKQTLGIAGTPAFMAPELLGQEPSLYDGPAVDLWSCGATLFMLVTGVPPWMAEDELTLSKRVQNDELVFPAAFATKLSPHLRNLLTRLLVKDPAMRMTMTQTMLHEWVTEEGADPLERFVDLQPQLIRVNSKRLMMSGGSSSAAAAAATSPSPLHAHLVSTSPALAGAGAGRSRSASPAVAAGSPVPADAEAAAEHSMDVVDGGGGGQDVDDDDDDDDEDAIITLVHQESTPRLSALNAAASATSSTAPPLPESSSLSRKRPGADLTRASSTSLGGNTSSAPSSPVIHVGDDLSDIFLLSPPQHTPSYLTLPSRQQQQLPQRRRGSGSSGSSTSQGNASGSTSSGGGGGAVAAVPGLVPMERTDSLDYAQIDVGRGGMINASNPAAADSTGTLYSSASSSSITRMFPSSSSAHSPHAGAASSSSPSLLHLQHHGGTRRTKKDVVDAFTKQRSSGLKRHVSSGNNTTGAGATGGSRGSYSDLAQVVVGHSSHKRGAFAPRSLSELGAHSHSADSPSSSALNKRPHTDFSLPPPPPHSPTKQQHRTTATATASYDTSFGQDVDVDDDDSSGMDDSVADENEEEDVYQSRPPPHHHHHPASPASATAAALGDMTIRPLPHGAPAIIKARRGSAVSHCRVKYGYGELQGLRSTMEDFIAIVPRLKKPETFYAAVFDGHGGDRVAKELKARFHKMLVGSLDFASNLPQAITKTCLALDRAMLHYCASELLQLESKIQQGDQQKSLFRTKGGGTASTGGLMSKQAEYSMDMLLRKTGSTAVMAMVRAQELTVAWVGDSRAVLCRAGSAVQVSHDHKASRADEMHRIREAGGTVDRQGRLYGDLAVSRAFGDLQHKGRELSAIVAAGAASEGGGADELFGAEGTLIALPDIAQMTLTAQDEFLILASDGIWDVMSNEEAVNFVRFHLHKHGDVRKAAVELVDKAVEMHSLDNVSAVVLAFVGKF